MWSRLQVELTSALMEAYALPQALRAMFYVKNLAMTPQWQKACVRKDSADSSVQFSIDSIKQWSCEQVMGELQECSKDARLCSNCYCSLECSWGRICHDARSRKRRKSGMT